MNSCIAFDVAANFCSPFFGDKTTKPPYIDILSSLNMVSSVTNTSTLGILVFSAILLIKSAFLMAVHFEDES